MNSFQTHLLEDLLYIVDIIKVIHILNFEHLTLNSDYLRGLADSIMGIHTALFTAGIDFPMIDDHEPHMNIPPVGVYI